MNTEQIHKAFKEDLRALLTRYDARLIPNTDFEIDVEFKSEDIPDIWEVDCESYKCNHVSHPNQFGYNEKLDCHTSRCIECEKPIKQIHGEWVLNE
jgi:hypothetical protein